MLDKRHQSAEQIRTFFSTFLGNFGLIVKLNLFFALSSLTIIGIPAGLTALSFCFLRVFRDEPLRPRFDYKTVFKKEFFRSLSAGGILLILLILTGGGGWVYRELSTDVPFYLALTILGFILCVLVLFMSFSVFPMIAIIDLPLKTILRNGLLLAVIQSPLYLLMFILGSLLTLFYLRFFPLSLIAVPIFYISPITFFTTWAAWQGIQKHVIQQESSASDNVSSDSD